MIDLWYLHFPDPGVPLEESIGAMAELVSEGKVRHLGLCNAGAEQVMAAHQVHPLAAVQVEYSLWTRAPEAELLPVVRELGVGFVAVVAARRRLLGRLGRPHRRRGRGLPLQPPALQPENLSANRDRFAPLRSLASELELTPAQLALAWLLHQAPDLVPIPGTRTPSHLDENLAAADVVLDQATLARIEELAPAGTAAGASLL